MLPDKALAGRRLLVTAGPTREALDPVRYLSNRSSGKMGYAVARAAREAGASVILVSGPVCVDAPTGIKRVDVESAADMLNAVHAHIGETDVFVGAAAVADYRPARVQGEKIKKHDESLHLELVRNPDILASVASLPRPPFTVGFAAETTDLVANAREKLLRKRLDMIAANRVGSRLAFDQDENELVLIWEDGELHLPMQEKTALARAMLVCVGQRFAAKLESEVTK